MNRNSKGLLYFEERKVGVEIYFLTKAQSYAMKFKLN